MPPTPTATAKVRCTLRPTLPSISTSLRSISSLILRSCHPSTASSNHPSQNSFLKSLLCITPTRSLLKFPTSGLLVVVALFFVTPEATRLDPDYCPERDEDDAETLAQSIPVLRVVTEALARPPRRILLQDRGKGRVFDLRPFAHPKQREPAVSPFQLRSDPRGLSLRAPSLRNWLLGWAQERYLGRSLFLKVPTAGLPPPSRNWNMPSTFAATVPHLHSTLSSDGGWRLSWRVTLKFRVESEGDAGRAGTRRNGRIGVRQVPHPIAHRITAACLLLWMAFSALSPSSTPRHAVISADAPHVGTWHRAFLFHLPPPADTPHIALSELEELAVCIQTLTNRPQLLLSTHRIPDWRPLISCNPDLHAMSDLLFVLTVMGSSSKSHLLRDALYEWIHAHPPTLPEGVLHAHGRDRDTHSTSEDEQTVLKSTEDIGNGGVAGHPIIDPPSSRRRPGVLPPCSHQGLAFRNHHDTPVRHSAPQQTMGSRDGLGSCCIV
ncbi:hypothetical protein NMY22_g10522 [Coprinellus aureogranulatus]|nr:hypothetical protein NMY22_g10522 [Coprinellus aureogranulatus]